MLFNPIKEICKIGCGKIVEEKWFAKDGKNYEPSGVYTYKGFKQHEMLENKKAFSHSTFVKKYLIERIMDSQYGLKQHLGGMIVFATSVNSNVDKTDKSKYVKMIQKAYLSTKNLILRDRKLNKLVKELNQEFSDMDKYQIGAFSIGKLFNGKYIDKQGKVYNDKSMTIEFGGVPSEVLLLFAIKVCQEFDQESVMVKDYNKNKIYLVDGEKIEGNTPSKVIDNTREELKKLDDINVDVEL